MDRIINYLLLTIIFVFDPLAIALVIAANYAFERIRPNTKKNLYGEKVKIEEDAGDSIKEEIEENLWDKPESWDKSIIDEEESSSMYEHAYKSPIKEERGLPEGYASEIGELEEKIKNTSKTNKRGPRGLVALNKKLKELKGKNNDDDDLVIRY